MKKFLILLILLLLLPAIAQAGDSYTNASAYAGAHVNAQTSSSATASTGNVSTGNLSVSQDYDDQAPAVSAPSVYTSAPCFVGISGGVSVAGFGASGGSGIEDKKCTVRETSRILYAQGEREASVRAMCVDGLAALALGPTKCAGMPVLLPVELPTCHDDEVVAKRLGVSQCRK